MATGFPDPLKKVALISEPNGSPTKFFVRQWNFLLEFVKNTLADFASLIARVTTLEDTTITVAAPINGGGQLKGPFTPIGHDGSGVTPGSYTNADITVDAEGHITAAANGGGGSAAAECVSPIAMAGFVGSGQLAAFVGNKFTPNRDISIKRMGAPLLPTINGAVYQAAICEVNGSNVLQTVALSSTFTNAGTANKEIVVDFSTPVTLTAGTTYLLLMGRNDATDTTASSYGASNTSPSAFFMPGTFDTSGFYLLPFKTPTVGQTATLTASAFLYSQVHFFTL